MNRETHAPSYLIRNAYSYCFRLRVPVDIQPYLDKKELRYSLRTGYLSEAKYKARVMAGLVQTLFRDIRELKMKLTDEQIQEIAVSHLKELVGIFNMPAEPLDTDMHPVVASLSLKKKLESLSYDKFKLTVDMETGRYADLVQNLPAILEPHGIDFSEVDQADESFAKLCQAILRVKLKAIEHYEAKVEGRGPVDDFDAAMDRALGKVQAPPESATTETEALSTIFEEYWNRKRGGWSTGSIRIVREI